jgi:carbamoyl-phosphate synthase large subunit
LKATLLIPSGAGAPGFAGILHCLKQAPGIRVLAGDINNQAYGRQLADGFFQTPPTDDPEYTKFILETALANQAEFILPITTRELLPLAEEEAKFRLHGIRLIASPLSALRIANNKAYTYEALKSAGLPYPEFKRVDNLESLINAVKEMNHTERVIFKPAVGNGSRGFGVILSQIESQHRNIILEKPGNPLYRWEELPFLLPRKFDGEMLVCEYLPGQEYSVDILVEKGRIHYALVRTREKMIGGISVQGRFVKQNDILHQTEKICALLGLHGPVGMQFRLRTGGEPMLLEINPRLQGTACSAIGAGVNIPLDTLRLEQGKTVLGKPESIYWGVGFSRHWSEVFF